jgi:heat shock protein HslJ
MHTIKNIRLFTIFILATIILTACSNGTPTDQLPGTQPTPTTEESSESPTSTSGEKTIYVGSELVDCEGEGPQQCMLVKENPTDEYSLFYDQIEGFVYDEGFEYELKVIEEPVENPPAGGSSIRWILVEVVGKSDVSATPIQGTVWTLAKYLNNQGELVSVLPESTITAAFEDGQVSGNAGCNQYFGAYTSEENNFSVTVIGLTEMYCEPENLMVQEGEYLAALESASTYRTTSKELEITNSENQIALVFMVAESTSLVGPQWHLNLMDDGEGKVVSTIAGTEVTLVFAEDGTLSGSAGCNSYSSSYEIEGEQITISAVASTMMACSEPAMIMEQEYSYLQMLQTVTRYQIKGNELELVNDSRGSRLNYTAQSSNSSLQPGLPVSEAPTLQELQNMTYTSEWTESGLAPLVDGEYREQAAPDSATEIVVQLTDNIVAGMLGLEQEASAVVLVSQPGGSGSFYDLAVVTRIDGEPVNITTSLIGDRIQINSMSIQDGEIILDMITHGPDDPMCCPTQHVIQRYAIQDDELVATGTEFITLTNVIWKWQEFQESNDNLTIVSDPEQYTLEFLDDGQVNVKADCNQAGGNYILAGSQLTIEITTSTLAICPPGSLSEEYLSLLNDAVSYIMEEGQLFIAIKFDTGIMKFSS